MAFLKETRLTINGRQAEELLARKRAQLEEASRLRAAVAQHHYGDSGGGGGHPAGEVGSEPAAAGGSGGLSANTDTAEQDRVKRAEIFRQVREFGVRLRLWPADV